MAASLRDAYGQTLALHDVELSPACDRWMQGDRYGRVTRVDETKGRVRVRLERSGKSLWFRADDVTRLPRPEASLCDYILRAAPAKDVTCA